MEKMVRFDDGFYKITERNLGERFHNADDFLLEGGDLKNPVSCETIEEAFDLMELVDEGVVVPGKMVHLAKMDLGKSVTLDPKYTSFEYAYGPKGVSFSSSVRSAARALPEDPEDYGNPTEYMVYTPVEKKRAKFDPEGTGDVEFRVTEPIKAKKIGLVSLTVDPVEPMKLKWLEKEG